VIELCNLQNLSEIEKYPRVIDGLVIFSNAQTQTSKLSSRRRVTWTKLQTEAKFHPFDGGKASGE